MVRIGLIGTESSHARAFAEIIGRSPRRATVTAVLEEGDGAGEQLAEQFGMPRVLGSLEEMTQTVDAVMIFYRDGARHEPAARRMLEAGVSVWLDKPFTPQVAQAKALYRLARQRGLTLDGGSTVRFSPDVQAFASQVRLRRDLLGGGFNYMGMADSPHGGLFFYGPHAMTLLAEMFGPRVRSMLALREAQSLIALARYDGYLVCVHMEDCGQSQATLYTPEGIVQSPLGFEDIYDRALQRFLELLSTGSAAPYEKLLAPVALLDALQRSLLSGREEPVDSWG